MEANEFMKERIKSHAPESREIISSVLFENDSTFLYEYFHDNDREQRKYYDFLLKRQGYYIIIGPHSIYEIDSHEVLLKTLAIAESFKIVKKPVDHRDFWERFPDGK